MTRTWLALFLEVVFFALAFGWRSWLQWRRTGSTGFVRPSRESPPAAKVGSVGFFDPDAPRGPHCELGDQGEADAGDYEDGPENG